MLCGCSREVIKMHTTTTKAIADEFRVVDNHKLQMST